mmetsp:Transcript_33154/g.51825  ORF Transcript_33154/g.51825 Transcript_33154/m.51825 type:complete len:486 (-) Transcript_33154:41-1498(-)
MTSLNRSNISSTMKYTNKAPSTSGSKPLAQGETQAQPIESLSPYIGNKWIIKARVTDKSPVRTWSNARSQGKLFSMTLVDESGPIQCTVFQDGVDKFFDMLVEGKVFFFSKGQIKNANKKYSSVNAEYEISMDKDGEIWPAHASDPSFNSLPQKVFNFLPIESLKAKEKGSMVDVLGVISSIGQPQATTTKAGNSVSKLNLVIADQTAQVDLTIWDGLAEQWDIPVGVVVGIKKGRINEFNGDISLSLSSSGFVDRDIPGTQPQALMSWYQEIEGKVNVPNISRGGMGSSRGSALYRNTLEEIQRLGLGKGEKPDYITVRGTVTHIKSDTMLYDACPNCNKKLIADQFNGGAYRCEKCDQVHDKPESRFLLSFMISDGTLQIWVTAFDDVASQFFGITAQELSKRASEDPNFTTVICTQRMYSQLVARLRVKEDRYGDSGEERTRSTLMGPVRWIGTPPGDCDAPVSTFSVENEIMIKEIESYFV